MNLRKRLILLTTIIIFPIIAFGCGAKDEGTENQAAEVNKIPVEVVQVTKGDFTKNLIINGVTNPYSIVNVTPKVAGAEKIVSISIREGDKVSAGQTIASLDQSTVKIQLEQAQKTYDDALTNYDRNKVLFDANVIAKAEFEKIESALQQAKSGLDAQKIAFDNTVVSAPISGIVTAVNVEQGTLASAQSQIATIVDISKLEIDSSINENQVNKVTVGQKIDILIPAASDEEYKGKINYISPMMDEKSKTYPIKITIDNSKNEIKAGMHAKVELTTDVHQNAIKVPRKAVITRDGVNKVFLVEDDKAVLKQVKVGLSNGTEIEILDGLKIGQQIVVTGNEDLVNGDLVTAVNRGDSK